jgi:hypothetical protein
MVLVAVQYVMRINIAGDIWSVWQLHAGDTRRGVCVEENLVHAMFAVFIPRNSCDCVVLLSLCFVCFVPFYLAARESALYQGRTE